MFKKGIPVHVIVYDDIQRYWFVLCECKIIKSLKNMRFETDMHLIVDKSCAFHTLKQAILECKTRNGELLEKYTNLMKNYDEKMKKYLETR
jgi:hypothetical protein